MKRHNPEVGLSNARFGQGRIQGLISGFELLGKYLISGCGLARKATGSDIESHNLYGQLRRTGRVGVIAFAVMVMFITAIVKFAGSANYRHARRAVHVVPTACYTAVFLLFMRGTWAQFVSIHVAVVHGFRVIAMRAVSGCPWYRDTGSHMDGRFPACRQRRRERRIVQGWVESSTHQFVGGSRRLTHPTRFHRLGIPPDLLARSPATSSPRMGRGNQALPAHFRQLKRTQFDSPEVIRDRH